MALDLSTARSQLRAAKRALVYWQNELYLSRTAPKPSRERIGGVKQQVLMHLTAVFNMQQCVKRLTREAEQQIAHWKAFIACGGSREC